jgi:flagellar basal body-associated protein FliL
MSEKATDTQGKRLGRRIVLVIILAFMVLTSIALIAAPFLPRM